MFYMYGSTTVAAFNIIEELLPGTDFVPTATIGKDFRTVLNLSLVFELFWSEIINWILTQHDSII